MTHLPIMGRDTEQWNTLLNEFMRVIHHENGTLPLNCTALNVRDFGAIGDGQSHPLVEVYGTLAEAQAIYPHATSLSDELDWAAIQAAINSIDPASGGPGGTVCVPPGTYLVSRAIDLKDNIHFKGSGALTTTIRLQLPTPIQCYLSVDDYLNNLASVLRSAGKSGVRITHLHIDGNKRLIDGSKGANPHLKTLGYPEGGLQGGITFVGWPAHLSLIPTRLTEDCQVEMCWVENCVDDGIAVNHARRVQIQHCACHDNGIIPPAPEFDFNMPEATNSFGIALWGNTEHCVVASCLAFRNPHAGILVGTDHAWHHQIRYCATDAIDISHFVEIDVPDPCDSNKLVKSPIALPIYLQIIGCLVDNRNQLAFRKTASACVEIGIVSHLTIQDCHCIVQYNAGISGHGRRVGNYDQTKYPPQDLEHNASGNAIINNRIYNVANPPISDSNHTQAPSMGIHLADWHDFMLSGNTVVGEYTIGLFLRRCRQGTVTGNVLLDQAYWAGVPATLQGTGLGVYGGTELTVTANAIRGFNVGIRETNEGPISADHNLILGNMLKNNGQPIAPTVGLHSLYATNLT